MGSGVPEPFGRIAPGDFRVAGVFKEVGIDLVPGLPASGAGRGDAGVAATLSLAHPQALDRGTQVLALMDFKPNARGRRDARTPVQKERDRGVGKVGIAGICT